MKAKNTIFVINVLSSILFLPSYWLLTDILKLGAAGILLLFSIWGVIILITLIFSIVSASKNHQPLLVIMGLMPLVPIITFIILFINLFCVNSTNCPEKNQEMVVLQSIFQIIPAAVIVICFAILTKHQNR
ncbi:hypothetical protein IJH16_01605 [Candidatus Saccharibacteria bacterium]|nr:hypothetical protein [Candidatus Saccharibacteria bacterium]